MVKMVHRIVLRQSELEAVAAACDFLAQTVDDVIRRDFADGREPEVSAVADATALSAVYHRITGEHTTFGGRLDYLAFGRMFGDPVQTLVDAY